MGGACQYERLFPLSGPLLKLLGFFKAPPPPPPTPTHTPFGVYSYSLSPTLRFNFETLPSPFPVHSYDLVHVV